MSRTAARKLDHPPGTFAAYHPDPLLVPGMAALPRWDAAARAAEAAIADFEQRHGNFAGRVGWALQRSESAGSSTIEDVTPSLRRVARAEAVAEDGGDPHDDAAREALGNIAATRLAAEVGDAGGPIAVDDLLAVHAVLMDHTSKPEMGGQLRPSWVRIGGVLGGYPPPAYVAPPAEEVPGLLDDLVGYINTTDHHPVVAAAVAHAQFEAIHPFRDGNGRAGRALIQAVLRKGGMTRYTTPPISALLALNQNEYIDAIAAVCFDGPADSESQAAAFDPWVLLFSSTAEASCGYAEGLIARIDAVVEGWSQKLVSRRGSAARKIAERLPEMPVFAVQGMADKLGIPLATAYRATDRLVAAGIIAPVRGKHRGRDLFEAPAILDVFKTEEGEIGHAGTASPATGAQIELVESRSASRKAKIAEAIRLRRAGRTLQEIGDALGMSASWARTATEGVARGGDRKRNRSR